MRAERERQRLHAYSVFHAALRRGDIQKAEQCQECGQPPRDFGVMVAHHANHARPLDVEWLCSTCHGKRGVEAALSSALPIKDWSAMVAKAKREGVSLRALVLGWLKDWIELGDAP